MNTSSKLSTEAKKKWKINRTIHEWMKPVTAGHIVDQYTDDLNAMARAEAELIRRGKLSTYLYKLAALIHKRKWNDLSVIGIGMIVTAPAETRAKALAEVLDEI
jgi:hypothetical protein